MNDTDKRCRVKICGVTREEDVEAICAAGADYIGFLVNINSPRSNTPARAAALANCASIDPVLLFLNSDFQTVMDLAARVKPAAVQLHGCETPGSVKLLNEHVDCEIWKALHLTPPGEPDPATYDSVMEQIKKYYYNGTDRILLDTMVKTADGEKTGGTGKTHDWNLAARIVNDAPCPVIIAGGINADNAADAVRTMSPYAVDLSSGVEKSKGIKDPEKIRQLIQAVRSA